MNTSHTPTSRKPTFKEIVEALLPIRTRQMQAENSAASDAYDLAEEKLNKGLIECLSANPQLLLIGPQLYRIHGHGIRFVSDLKLNLGARGGGHFDLPPHLAEHYRVCEEGRMTMYYRDDFRKGRIRDYLLDLLRKVSVASIHEEALEHPFGTPEYWNKFLDALTRTGQAANRLLGSNA